MSSSPVAWGEHSFFLEMKPRTDLASLFIDCPVTTAVDDKENHAMALDLIRIEEHSLRLGVPKSIVGNEPLCVNPDCMLTNIGALKFTPNSVCTPTWADKNRLFMCKIHAEPTDNVLVPKTSHRLASDMNVASGSALEEFMMQKGAKSLACRRCRMPLIKESKDVALSSIPTDDFLATSPSADFYCRDSCGASCDPNKHNHGARIDCNLEADKEWLPTASRIMLAHTKLFVHNSILIEDNYTLQDKILACAGCCEELGNEVKNHKDTFELHYSVVSMAIQKKDFMEFRCPSSDWSVFFAQLILSCCEAQSSLKLVIRSLNKTPRFLVWLLDSYVVMASGKLERDALENGDAGDAAFNGDAGDIKEKKSDRQPFAAIKMLYKVFDAQSAASDPRANGEDASVGLVDLPHGAVLMAEKTLLQSSHSLPPACRSVGQFYVGYLKLSDHM